MSFPGPAGWCRQTRRNARLHRWVLRSFPWNAKAPSVSAPLLSDFGDALGRLWGSLKVASGCLPVGYQMASGWLRGGRNRGCKTLSVNGSSSLRPAPLRGRRSGGERSEPERSRPRRGAASVINWSRAGHNGFLLGCHQTHPKQIHDDPPHRS
jgi:hypothetical protein